VRILEPLFDVVTAIMLAFHTLFESLGFDPAGGWAWGLAIVGLVLVIRILLIPLFVKQIKAQRGMQLLQPEVRKIQQKFKGRNDTESKQAQQRELMALYRDNGTNPLSSCLPILAQMPIFFALFYVLNGIGATPPTGRGLLSDTEAAQAADATILGAPFSAKFLGADDVSVQLVTAVMIIMMSASQFYTQRQLILKGMPASALDNPYARQQKMLMYIFPLVFAVTGVNFPIGVLLYWLTTNVWSMGQQLYVIRRNPAPGSPAAEELERRRRERQQRRAEKHGTAADAGEPTPEPPPPPKPRQRQQPKRTPRGKRQGPGAKPPTPGTSPEGPGARPPKGPDDEMGDGAEPAAS